MSETRQRDTLRKSRRASAVRCHRPPHRDAVPLYFKQAYTVNDQKLIDVVYSTYTRNKQDVDQALTYYVFVIHTVTLENTRSDLRYDGIAENLLDCMLSVVKDTDLCLTMV